MFKSQVVSNLNIDKNTTINRSKRIFKYMLKKKIILMNKQKIIITKKKKTKDMISISKVNSEVIKIDK